MSKPLVIALQLIGIVMVANGVLSGNADWYLVGIGALLILIAGTGIRKRLQKP